ncbi:MAG: hypothetical protein HYS12_21560 [Planctomycetes bacterium]|nr:hypothetical protein [Planctomycetota bacterium]
MRANTVKRTLRAGGVSLGTMVFEFDSTGLGRLIATAGAEFVVFDMEHTGWALETLRMLVATTRPAGVVPMVRVPAVQYHFLARALDIGAMGLMVPMVENAEQARLIVQSAKYPPAGRRGAAFAVAHDDYAAGDLVETMRSANEEGLLIAQVETAVGLENAEEIAAVEGIDVLWVGQFDLTNFLGIPGQFSHPRLKGALERVVRVARQHGKTAAILVMSVDEPACAIVDLTLRVRTPPPRSAGGGVPRPRWWTPGCQSLRAGGQRQTHRVDGGTALEGTPPGVVDAAAVAGLHRVADREGGRRVGQPGRVDLLAGIHAQAGTLLAAAAPEIAQPAQRGAVGSELADEGVLRARQSAGLRTRKRAERLPPLGCRSRRSTGASPVGAGR